MVVLLNDAIFICGYSAAGRTVAGRARRVISLDLSDSQFSGNQLSGEIPPELANLTELTHLFLARNQLSVCLPAILRKVLHNDLDRLDLPDCGAP